MNLRNSPRRWGAVSQGLHWLVVVLVIAQFLLASAADDLPAGLAKLVLLARHKSVGITILGLAVLRLAWRAMSPGPPPPTTGSAAERALARLTHGGLYTLLFLVPLAGWAQSSAKNYAVSWFGLVQLPNLVPADESLYRALHEAHEVLAWTLAGLAGLHAAAALYHHFLRRDDVLRRMLPFLGLLAGAALLLAPDASRAGTFVADPARSTLGFRFVQAGATNEGRFARFTVQAEAPGPALAGGKLKVQVDVASLDTKDADRDSTLRGPDFFDVARTPAAEFTTTGIAADGPERILATGTLALRGVTRPVKIPMTLRRTPDGALLLEGSTTVRRLDYGIGQGDWRSTEWVGDEVVVSWSVRLVPGPAAP